MLLQEPPPPLTPKQEGGGDPFVAEVYPRLTSPTLTNFQDGTLQDGTSCSLGKF